VRLGIGGCLTVVVLGVRGWLMDFLGIWVYLEEFYLIFLDEFPLWARRGGSVEDFPTVWKGGGVVYSSQKR
jgi:hypothetical protein